MRKGYMKKGIVAVLLASLIVILLAGCSGDKKEGGATGTSSQAPSEKANAEPVELTIMTYDGDTIAQDENSPIYKAVREKLNVKFKVITAPFSGYDDKVNVTIASGQVPDLFNYWGIARLAQYKSWIKEGFVLPLSDVADKYPNIAKQLKSFDSFAKMTDGKHYGLPIISYSQIDSPAVNDHTIYVRKDWLDKLGLPVPTTIDEFANVAKAFAQNDPDGNNKADTYGYTSDGLWWDYPIFNAFDTSFDRYRKADGQWIPEVIQDETKQAVAFLKSMYDDKIMDPEFVINNGDKKIEKFVSGKAGMIIHNGRHFYNDLYDKFKAAYPDKDPKSMFVSTGILESKQGNKRLDGFPNFWFYTFVSNKASPEKQQKALELLDFLGSEEGINLMRWGIEGEHYTKEGDKFVNTLPIDENGKQQTIKEIDATAKLMNYVTWDSDFVSDQLPNREEVLNNGKEGIESSNPDLLYGMYIDENVLSPEIGKEVNDYIFETLVKLIVSSKNFDQDWEAFVQMWLDKGGQKVWDETSKQALAENR